MSGYVDLKRSFVPVDDDAEPELAIGQLWGRKYGGWLDWPDVLNHPRVVLLAEAQSGYAYDEGRLVGACARTQREL